MSNELAPTQSAPVLALQNETAGAAAAALAFAETQAFYAAAQQRPRDIMKMRKKALEFAARPAAAESAKYSLPRKVWDPETRTRKTVYICGLTIRFAEFALRALGNIKMSATITYDDHKLRIVRVKALDGESNTPIEVDVPVEKWVEKKDPFGDRSKFEQRVNSYSDIVYIVPATDSEVTMKQNALVSKARRNLILQLVDGDILDEVKEQIDRTLDGERKRDPKGAIKKMVDGFARLGVSLAQMGEYLGHNIDAMTEEEFAELRDVGIAIKEEESTWVEALEARRERLQDGVKAARPQSEADAERAGLIKKIAAAKVSRGPAVEEAMRAAGLDPMTPLERVDVAVLAKVAQAIDAAAKARASKPETANGKGD